MRYTQLKLFSSISDAHTPPISHNFTLINWETWLMSAFFIRLVIYHAVCRLVVYASSQHRTQFQRELDAICIASESNGWVNVDYIHYSPSTVLAGVRYGSELGDRLRIAIDG